MNSGKYLSRASFHASSACEGGFVWGCWHQELSEEIKWREGFIVNGPIVASIVKHQRTPKNAVPRACLFHKKRDFCCTLKTLESPNGKGLRAFYTWRSVAF